MTGSFGGQLNLTAALGLGLIPPVRQEAVAAVPNGAGLGAAMFLSDEGFARAEQLAARAEQVDLEKISGFSDSYVAMMNLSPDGFL